jgi:hypothetical protein
MKKTKSIMIWLEESDKKIIEDAAHKERIATAAWARNVLVSIASEQMGVAR